MIQCDVFGIEEHTLKSKKEKDKSKIKEKSDYLGIIMDCMINRRGLKVKQ